jgi:membrane protease YdiL (CAAX protease family)
MFYFTLLFVAPAEEILFRGVLPNLTEERYILGKVPVIVIASQLAFAVFHIAAYGGIGSAMVMVLILGIIWVYVARRWGLFVTMGSHTAYNLTVLGVLSGGVV